MALAVILSREATKGSLSIQGFYGRGATAILSLASLAQDDYRGRFATEDDPQGLARSGGQVNQEITLNLRPSPAVKSMLWRCPPDVA
jgi:hypothetical protein